MGVVPGSVWQHVLRLESTYKSHRTRDWFVPFVARRLLVRLLLPSRVAAQLRPARQLLRTLRLPRRQDSVIPSSIFSGNSPQPSPHLIWSSAFAHPNLSPTVCGRNPTACVAECPENYEGRPVGNFAIAIILKRQDLI